MREFIARRWHRLVRRVPGDPGPLRPVTFEDPDPLQRALLDSAALLERILNENIVPWWVERVVDRDLGGYLLHHDVEGRWKGPADRFSMAQFRTLWFFARLAGEGRLRDAAALARHGLEFASLRLWDPEHEGFVSAVSHDGSDVTDGRKHLYDQTFAVYAICEYALATGGGEGLELAERTVALLKSRYEDPVHGGFHMEFARDWSSIPDSGKRLNETVHVLEALTLYDQVRPGDRWVRDQLHRLVLLLTGTVLRKSHGTATDAHRPDWSPVYGGGVEVVSYGHDLETIALVAAACNRIGTPLPLIADWMRSLMEFTLRWGVDPRSGGVYHAGPLNGPASDRRKTWWVQAEVLVGALTAYRVTGDPRHARLYLDTLHWIRTRHVDRDGGDWHAFVERDGSASGDKAYQWKGPYHNGRAMMQCLRLLAPGNPLAPDWLVPPATSAGTV